MSRFFNLRNIGYFLIILSSILFMTGELINDRFWLADFEVYYKAAWRIIHGENLYRIESDGFYIFKYSPTSAIFFIPFLIVPFSIAKYIYWFFLTTTIVLSFKLCLKLANNDNSNLENSRFQNTVLISAILVLAIHYLRELHLGQVNQLLFLLYILTAYFFVNKNKIGLTLTLAISLFIKPFTLIFIPYLLIKRKYKEIILFTSFCLIFFLIPFIFYKSFETTIQQYQLWITELKIELSNKQSLTKEANHTIFSILARMTPIKYILATNSLIKIIYQLIILSGIGISYIWFFKQSKNNEKTNPIYDFALLIASIPLIAFTSENAFIFSQLLVFVILSQFRNLSFYERIFAVLGFVFIGGDFKELVGETISNFLNNKSFVSIGTIMLILILFKLKFNHSKNIS